MNSWQTRLNRMDHRELVEELTSLELQIPVVRSRAKVIGTPAEAVIFDELNAERSRLRKEYSRIPTSTHPNIVATALAKLQGKEEQVAYLIKGWEYAKERNSTLDTQIEFCKKLITERREHEQTRRIGNE